MLLFCLWPVLTQAQEAGEDGLEGEKEPPLEIDTELLRRRFSEEAAAELVSLKIGDSEVELLISGFWKGTFSANWGMGSSSLGVNVVSNDTPFLFEQEADLTLSLWVWEKWFVEASFLDDYDINTYRLGYQGFAGETVQYVGLGNTGLDFPAFPYLDLGGDSPSSFGIYGKFGGGDLVFHSLVRYDAAQREERVFVGDRERTYSYIPVDMPIRGRSFVLPHEDLDSAPVLFIEDEEGDIRDDSGRRWRRAGTTEYSVSAHYGLVELTAAPSGLVAAAYSYRGRSIGSIRDDVSFAYTGSGYLKAVQDFFGSAALSNFPQTGSGAGKPGKVRFSGGYSGEALVIYEPGTFSPFERLSRYQAPVSSAAAAAFVKLSTGDRLPGYELLLLDSALLSASQPLLPPEDSARGIYALSETPSSADKRELKSLWPLGQEAPLLYLPGQRKPHEDRGIRFTNYGSASSSYNIGTDIVPGSVEVFRGAIADPNFSYSESSGTVSLQNPASFNETIRITYLKRSTERRNGSLAVGLGVVYESPEDPFSTQIGVGLRWNIDSESYSDEGASNTGTIGFGARVAWDYPNFKTAFSLGLGYEQPDSSGLYRISGMEGSELIFSMPPETSFISKVPSSPTIPPVPPSLTLPGRADLVYRNYRNTNVLGVSSLETIDWHAPVIAAEQGPYPARDSPLSSQVLVAEFALTTNKYWTGFQVPLAWEGAALERAEKIDVPFRFYDIQGGGTFEVYVQFGAMTNEDDNFPENPELLAGWKVFSATDALSAAARIVTLSLDDAHRQRLKDARYLRLLVVRDSGDSQGRILLAPPIVRGASFRPITSDGGGIKPAPGNASKRVSAEETVQGRAGLEAQYGSTIDRLHPDGSRTQRVLFVQWQGLDPGEGAGVDGRTPAVPLSNYERLSFFVQGPQAATGTDQGVLNQGELHFLLGEGPASLHRPNEVSLEAHIPLRAFSAGQWSKVELAYLESGGRKVLVDGVTVSDARISYRSGKQQPSSDGSGKSAYIAVLVNPPTGTTLPNASLYVDELILEVSISKVHLNLGGNVQWQRPGVLLSAAGVPLVADLSLETFVESGFEGNPFDEDQERRTAVSGRGSAGITLLGFKFEGNAYVTATKQSTDENSSSLLWSAGHAVSRSLGPFTAKELFSYAPDDSIVSHTLSFDLKEPFSLGAQANMEEDGLKRLRKWTAAGGFSIWDRFSFAVDAAANWTQPHEEREDESINAAAPLDYGEAWRDAWYPLRPDDGRLAEKRDLSGGTSLRLAPKPFGAELSMKAASAFSRAANTTRSSADGRFDLPYENEAGYAVLLSWNRKFTHDVYYSGASVADDSRRYGENIQTGRGLWTLSPYHTFSNTGIAEGLDSTIEDAAYETAYVNFGDRLSLNIGLPANYELSSFIVPQRIDLYTERALEQRLDTRQNTLNIGAGLGFESINIFGAFGVASLFDFYRSDEYSHALEGVYVIAEDGDNAFRLQSSFSATFYGFSDSELSLSNSVSFYSPQLAKNKRLQESFTLAWTAPAPNSILGSIYGWFAGSLRGQKDWLSFSTILNAVNEKFRKETLEFVYDRTYDARSYSFIMGHESIVRIESRLNLSAFAKLNYIHDKDSTSFLLNMGTSLTITF
ncbi:hypothetical protein ACYULU_05260 [Breznakiellaceae bacterium SP9]